MLAGDGARAWEFRHPNGLRVARPYGPVTHQPELLPEGSDSIEGMGVIADLIEALAVIQDRTTTQITVPDFAKLTMLEARPILHTADLIRGAAVTVPWEGITIHVHPGVDAIARLRLPTISLNALAGHRSCPWRCIRRLVMRVQGRYRFQASFRQGWHYLFWRLGLRQSSLG